MFYSRKDVTLQRSGDHQISIIQGGFNHPVPKFQQIHGVVEDIVHLAKGEWSWNSTAEPKLKLINEIFLVRKESEMEEV